MNINIFKKAKEGKRAISDYENQYNLLVDSLVELYLAVKVRSDDEIDNYSEG
jgi:hypothetical protein